MKPGEIWGYTDPKTGKKRGVKIIEYDPPRYPGAPKLNLAWGRCIKTERLYCIFLSPEGTPSTAFGTPSPNWKLIETATGALDKTSPRENK